jgi:hypothetical protein
MDTKIPISHYHKAQLKKAKTVKYEQKQIISAGIDKATH